METYEALLVLAALSQATRLDVFRLLIEHEPEGLPAGEIARRLAVPANTMSAHLGVLSRAGVICAERRSRTIIYRAELECVRRLVLFLLKDCCAGRPEVCVPLIADLAPCCPPREPAHG